jgi:hypothetical protein
MKTNEKTENGPAGPFHLAMDAFGDTGADRTKTARFHRRWPPALLLALLAVGGTAAAGDLQTYRLKAAISANCAQLHGTVIYGKSGPQCNLPKAVNKSAPLTKEVQGKLAPLTARH